MNNIISLTLLGIILNISAVNAQSREPAWRVINTISATALPGYMQEGNPFPIQQRPVNEAKKLIDYEALEKAKNRAKLLTSLREVILNNKAYMPSLNNHQIRGYLNGKDGQRVLINKNWLKKGSRFRVPIEGTQPILSMLESLKKLDPKVGSKMEKEIDNILPEGENLSMRVTKITPKKVNLVDEKGRRYTLKIK